MSNDDVKTPDEFEELCMDAVDAEINAQEAIEAYRLCHYHMEEAEYVCKVAERFVHGEAPLMELRTALTLRKERIK